MRPISRGEKTVNYKIYQNARDPLFKSIGHYCSFCEMDISNMAEVDHVVPKKNDIAPELILEWTNLLLSCKYCNTSKGSRNQNRDNYFFPDEDNTALYFKYSEDEIIKPTDGLSTIDNTKALNTIDLMKLDRTQEAIDEEGKRDTRPYTRGLVWQKAKSSLLTYEKFMHNLERVPDEVKNDIIKNQHEQIGNSPAAYFSVWMEVFRDYPECQKFIIDKNKGIAKGCYLCSGAVDPSKTKHN